MRCAVPFLAPVIAAVCLFAQADLPDLAPHVTALFPLGGQTGGSVEVRLFGERLEGATALEFARPDLTAEVVSAESDSARVRIAIGPKVPAGLHDFRLRTPHGAFVGVFHVSTLPALREAEPNNDIAHAQPIAGTGWVDGIVEEEDYDVFRLHAVKGETLIFDLTARRAHSHFDGTLAVLDARGNELDFSDDYYFHKDPRLIFRAPETADYFVRVSGTHERGSADSVYRLAAGAFPNVDRVLPTGLQRGKTAEFTLSGVNLSQTGRVILGDGAATGTVLSTSADRAVVRMAVPAGIPPGPQLLHVWAGDVEAPLQIPILVSDFVEELAVAQTRRDHPQPVRLPVAINGVLPTRRAAAFFGFDVQAGERLAFEVDAMKLGYRIDPVIAVYDGESKLAASNDDRLQQNGAQPPNLDPYLVHTFEQAGRYTLMIRDSAERGDPNFVFRIAMYPAEPDFDVRVLQPALTLYPGHTSFLPVRVRRLGGWDSPVTVRASGLPTGISADPVTAEPKDTIVKDNCALERKLDGTDVLIPIHAAQGNVGAAFPFSIRAEGTWQGKTVEHGSEVFYRWESVGKVTGPIEDQKLLATVTDLPPVLLEVPSELSLTPGKPGRLRVIVKRFDGASGPLTLEPESPIDGLTFENNLLPAGAAQVTLRVVAQREIAPVRFRLRAGQARSEPISLRVEKPSGGAQ